MVLFNIKTLLTISTLLFNVIFSISFAGWTKVGTGEAEIFNLFSHLLVFSL